MRLVLVLALAGTADAPELDEIRLDLDLMEEVEVPPKISGTRVEFVNPFEKLSQMESGGASAGTPDTFERQLASEKGVRNPQALGAWIGKQKKKRGRL